MIYLDMDGVLADFDKRGVTLFGMPPRDYEAQLGAQAFWAKVDADHNFYRELEKMPDADQLVAGVLTYSKPTILTGLPLAPWVEQQKREWAAEHYPDLDVICCRARDKANHCRPGDILIDDRNQYLMKWKLAGGVFIHHTSAQLSLERLAELHAR